MAKPKVAVYKFSSCDGCQLSLLNLEDELLDLAEAVELAYFLEARSRILPGPYDVALVEGSVSTPHEAERIQEIRAQARYLVALGTCATAGGIQALRNFGDKDDLALMVYEHPEYLHALDTSTPISEHVTIDLELWGCPVNKYQALEVIAALLQNRKPNLPSHAVCLDCKRDGHPCVAVAYGLPCLGPVTRTGCGALCPSNGRGCYGCFGPSSGAEVPALIAAYEGMDTYPGETFQLLRYFTGYAPAFKHATEKIEAKGATA
jgi:coenzyme F420-reducing hydrogenase gamma subunit